MFEFITIDDGKSFGEMALINNKPRGATILCKEDCHFAVMDREDFRGTLMKLEEKTQDTYIQFLRKLPLFHSWGYTALYKLLFAVEKLSVRRGEVMYEQGDVAESFYLIYSGEFYAYK